MQPTPREPSRTSPVGSLPGERSSASSRQPDSPRGTPRPRTANSSDSLLLDVAIGALAGAAAVWMMNRVDWYYRRGLDEKQIHRRTRPDRAEGMGPARVLAAKATDELINATVGLSGRPRDDPWIAPARGPITHLVYGLVTGLLRRALNAPASLSSPRSGQDRGWAPADAATKRAFVRYSDDIEVIEPDEEETFDAIIRVMAQGGQITRERYGHAVRTSHAKAHGLLKGELRVLEGLARELRQGLFATPRSYPVILRLAHVPGEFLDDRRVSTPRGLALKVLDVNGPKLAGHKGERTQDFVLDTGKVFIAPGAKLFLAQITATELAMPMPQGIKQAVSSVSRAGNAALHALGLESANLDFYGHPFLHPLAEAYFSQCPIRYGAYIAKLAVRPVSPGLRALMDQAIDPEDENGLRTAVVKYFRDNPAEFEVGIQLCTDLGRMPVENANAEWPEEESPYRPVARLILPPQDAYSPARQAFVEEDLLFCPAHSLAAHRPLGSIMRARMKAYEVLGRARREQNGRPVREPRSIAEMPD